MLDPGLERRLIKVRELMKLWQEFHIFLKRCEDEQMGITQKDEAEFLRIKSQIAIRHDALMDSIDERRESAATASAMMTVVENCILLRTVQRMSSSERKRMEIEWHDAYLLVNDTIGILEEEHDKLATVNEGTHVVQIYFDKVKNVFLKVTGSHGVKLTVVGGGIIAGLIVLPAFGVYNYDWVKGLGEPGEKIYYQIEDALRKTVWTSRPHESWKKFMELNEKLAVLPKDFTLDSATAEHDIALMKKLNELVDAAAGGSTPIYQAIDIYGVRLGGRACVIAVMFEEGAQANDFKTNLRTAIANFKKDEVGAWSKANADLYYIRRSGNVVYAFFGQNNKEYEALRRDKGVM